MFSILDQNNELRGYLNRNKAVFLDIPSRDVLGGRVCFST